MDEGGRRQGSGGRESEGELSIRRLQEARNERWLGAWRLVLLTLGPVMDPTCETDYSETLQWDY